MFEENLKLPPVIDLRTERKNPNTCNLIQISILGNLEQIFFSFKVFGMSKFVICDRKASFLFHMKAGV